MRKLFVATISFLCTLSILILIYINVRIEINPSIEAIGSDTINADLLAELRGLKEASENNAGEKMQQLFPEGYLFFYTLYGISCSEFAARVDKRSSLYEEIHGEAQRSFDLVNTEQARLIFPVDLSMSYGAFYNGWTTYFLGKKLLSESADQRDTVETNLFVKRCAQMATTLRVEIYPPSYYHSAWPGDAMLCVAALALHDRLFPPRYKEDIKVWIQHVQANLDTLHLIPHSVQNGPLPLEESRGSSLSLMLCFLPDIDKEFATQQFERYKKHFLVYRLGLPAIREYPASRGGLGDVDSGPVIFGVGASATITAQRTMNVFGDYSIAVPLRNSIEAFGFPLSSGGRKKYLFGHLPVADAFIAWGHSAAAVTLPDDTSVSWKFHFYSIAIVALLAAILWRVRKLIQQQG